MRNKRSLLPLIRAELLDHGFSSDFPYKYWQLTDDDVFVMPTQRNAAGRFCGIGIFNGTRRYSTYVVEARTRHDVWINIRREILERDSGGAFNPENLSEDKYLRKSSSKPKKRITANDDNDIDGTFGFIEI